MCTDTRKTCSIISVAAATISVKMGDSLNFLLCHQTESSLNEDDNNETIERSEPKNPHFASSSSSSTTIGDDDEVLKENQRFETEPMETTSSFHRLIAIDWILTTRTRFGFQNQTAYIAISYLDLFLKRRFIGRDESSWAIHLLSVACLSLAAKMEERIVPGLSQYPQDHDFVFKPDVILKTELMILSTLDWKMNLITPFHYFNYFIAKISLPTTNQSLSKDLVLLRSSESLLAFTKEISFTDYRQFVVAAATVMLASSSSSSFTSSLTREEMVNKFGSISWWTSNDNENVYLCYKRMQEIEGKKHMTPPPEVAVSRSGDNQPPASGSGGGAKRRLSFDDDSSDQTSAAKRMRRL